MDCKIGKDVDKVVVKTNYKKSEYKIENTN